MVATDVSTPTAAIRHKPSNADRLAAYGGPAAVPRTVVTRTAVVCATGAAELEQRLNARLRSIEEAGASVVGPIQFSTGLAVTDEGEGVFDRLCALVCYRAGERP